MAILNGWQRLWVVCSILLVLPAAIVVLAERPYRDPDILRELAAPECQVWRNLPIDDRPDSRPYFDSDKPCAHLQRFLYDKPNTNVRSVRQYEQYLTMRKIRAWSVGIVSWVFVAGLLYAIGWASAWIRRGFARNA